MALEAGPKRPSLEEKIDQEIEKIISAYPDRSKLPETFSQALSQLKVKFESLAKGEFKQEGGLDIRYNRHTNSVYYIEDSEKIKTTVGEVVSGEEWGNKFNLNYTEFNEKENSKKLYESYVLAFVKRETLDLLDTYILEREISTNKAKQNITTQTAYEGIEARRNTDPREMVQTGAIAEKMVQSLFMRLAIDNPSLGFEIININAYQDVAMKIDFIVKIKNVEKGVRTEITKNIQLTISSDPRKIEMKEEQLKKFQDVILVQMPELTANEFYKKWQGNKSMVAGPDKLLSEKVEQFVLEKILKS